MHKNLLKAVVSISLSLCFIATAQAEMSREEYAIKFRKGGYTMISWYSGPLYYMSRGEMPYDKALFARNAEYLAMLSKMPKDGFIPGSDKGETKAKPEIWSKADKFKEVNDRFENETAKLAEVAKGGNFEAVKEQYGRVSKVCKACHEDFKKKAD